MKVSKSLVRCFSSKFRPRYGSRIQQIELEQKMMEHLSRMQSKGESKKRKLHQNPQEEELNLEMNSVDLNPSNAHQCLFAQDKVMYQRFGNKTLGHFDNLPQRTFPGVVSLVTTETEDEQAFQVLEKELVVGIDTESQPVFRKGEKNPLSLIQISTSNRAFLYQLFSSQQKIPRGLAEVLSNPKIIKAGQALSNDIPLLSSRFEHAHQPLTSIIDVEKMAKFLGFKKTALRTLCKVMLGFDISKSQQTSNWGARVLCTKQKSYAATDAWAPRQILLACCGLDAEIVPSFQLWDYPLKKSSLFLRRPKKSRLYDTFSTYQIVQIARSQDSMFIPIHSNLDCS